MLRTVIVCSLLLVTSGTAWAQHEKTDQVTRYAYTISNTRQRDYVTHLQKQLGLPIEKAKRVLQETRIVGTNARGGSEGEETLKSSAVFVRLGGIEVQRHRFKTKVQALDFASRNDEIMGGKGETRHAMVRGRQVVVLRGKGLAKVGAGRVFQAAWGLLRHADEISLIVDAKGPNDFSAMLFVNKGALYRSARTAFRKARAKAKQLSKPDGDIYVNWISKNHVVVEMKRAKLRSTIMMTKSVTQVELRPFAPAKKAIVAGNKRAKTSHRGLSQHLTRKVGKRRKARKRATRRAISK